MQVLNRWAGVLPALFMSIAALGQQRVNIIPKPLQVTEKEGWFQVDNATRVSGNNSRIDYISRVFADGAGVTPGKKGNIRFELTDRKTISDTLEYRLSITPKEIRVQGSSPTSVMYGMQTLLQLVLTQPDMHRIPCATVSDRPRFGYRGLHLDVSRHFYPVTFIKKYLDVMALYKMNTFHWHLTDGAGWRLEIKKYPELTRKAAWRTASTWKEWWRGSGKKQYSEEGAPNAYGGFYTQDEAREIVEYAGNRGITVIPEIEMPGHSEEVLAVYPHLSCAGQPYKSSDFCLGNDSVFTFLEDVLTETMAIFPSAYIHIGGDEASKKSWKDCPKCQQRIRTEHLANVDELQSYSIRRMEKFLVAHGRKLLGWDEILEGGLAPEATVMSWRGEKGGITAASQDHDVVMTPGTYCYFDGYQADPVTQPEAIGGFLPLSKVYSYEPIPAELPAGKAHHVLGAQANVWTEFIPNTDHVEYMVFPRMLALSEVLWTDKGKKDWEDFKTRLQAHYRLLQRLHVNYYRPSYQLQVKTKFDYTAGKTLVWFDSEQFQPQIRYTLNDSMPDVTSTLYNGPFEIRGSAKVKAAIFKDTAMMGPVVLLPVDYHKAINKKVTYNTPYSPAYVAQKDSTLTNGYRGTLTYADGQWQGFLKNLDVVIDMEKVETLNSLSVNFMQLTGPGVYMPLYVEVSLSEDGKKYTPAQKVSNDVPATQALLTFKDFIFQLKGAKARYIKVYAPNQRGFLFADEIIVY